MQERYGRVSVERVLSGPGPIALYSALASLEGQETGPVSPEDIVSLALSGESPLAIETEEIFCGWLGDVAGDVALMYVAGGVSIWLGIYCLLSLKYSSEVSSATVLRINGGESVLSPPYLHSSFPVNHLFCVVAPIYWIASNLF